MRIRRLIALIVFAAATWLAAKSRGGEFLGMLDPVVFLIAALVAIVALIAAIFGIGLGKPNFADSGFGVHEPVGIGLGKLGLLIFAVAPLFIAVRGIYRGVIPTLLSDNDVVFSRAPLQFLAILGVWVGLGVAVLALRRRVNASLRSENPRRSRR